MAVSPLIDRFEKGIDTRHWTLKQVVYPNLQLGTSTDDAGGGDRSVTVSVGNGDPGVSCNVNVPCQRAEVRLHGNFRPVYGEVFWHGFAFKVSGDIPNYGSLRTIVGQWKAPFDNSPILAHRFDNGVHHISTQDGPTRKIIASAAGDYDRIKQFEDAITTIACEPRYGVPALKRLEAARARTRRGAPMDEETKQLTTSLVRELPLGEDAAKLFEEFSFIHDLEEFAQQPDIEIECGTDPVLPDPKTDWVYIEIKMKAGRTDNVVGPKDPGFIEIYANGKHVATARGNLGGQHTREPPGGPQMYYKFGIYRDVSSDPIKLHMDNWYSGPRRLSGFGSTSPSFS